MFHKSSNDVFEERGWKETPVIERANVERVSAALSGVALKHAREVSRLLLEGRDGLDLLHRLSTNDLLRWPQTSLTLTALTTEKGRIIDAVRVVKYGSGHLLLGSADAEEEVLRWIIKYTIADDVAVRSITNETDFWMLVGPGSEGVAARWDDKSSARPPYFISDATTELPMVYILEMGNTDGSVSRQAGKEYVPILDAAEWDLLRILYGMPAYGRELDSRFNPYEAGLDRFISREKGCYVGQEVLARIETYHRDRKTLAGVVERWQETPFSGLLFREGTQIGELTSVASIPYEGQRVGLAVLPATAAEPGTVLTTEQGREATVSAIPIHHT